MGVSKIDSAVDEMDWQTRTDEGTDSCSLYHATGALRAIATIAEPPTLAGAREIQVHSSDLVSLLFAVQNLLERAERHEERMQAVITKMRKSHA